MKNIVETAFLPRKAFSQLIDRIAHDSYERYKSKRRPY